MSVVSTERLCRQTCSKYMVHSKHYLPATYFSSLTLFLGRCLFSVSYRFSAFLCLHLCLTGENTRQLNYSIYFDTTCGTINEHTTCNGEVVYKNCRIANGSWVEPYLNLCTAIGAMRPWKYGATLRERSRVVHVTDKETLWKP